MTLQWCFYSCYCTFHLTKQPSSKALLFKYLRSTEVTSCLLQDAVQEIENFLRSSVIPHEQHYCFYLRKSIRHFDMYTNNEHEGTNNGIKSSATPVRGIHSMDKATKIMVDQDQRKFGAQLLKESAKCQGSAMWSVSSTVDYVTEATECHLAKVIASIGNYASLRTKPNLFFVRYSAPRVTSESKLPRFDRLRTVRLEHDGTLRCDCQFFEAHGKPCHHQAHVIFMHGNRTEFLHKDTASRWWRRSCVFAMKAKGSCTDSELLVKTSLEALRRCDVGGPCYEEDGIPASFPVYVLGEMSSNAFKAAEHDNASAQLLFSQKATAMSVLNYTTDDVVAALALNNSDLSYQMSQVTCISEENGECMETTVETTVDANSADNSDITGSRHVLSCVGTENDGRIVCKNTDSLNHRYRLIVQQFSALVNTSPLPGQARVNHDFQGANQVFQEVMRTAGSNERSIGYLISSLELTLMSMKEEQAETTLVGKEPKGTIVSTHVSRPEKRLKVSHWHHK